VLELVILDTTSYFEQNDLIADSIHLYSALV